MIADMDTQITKTNNYIYVWKKLNTGGIRLFHMYGTTPVCIVPEDIEGTPVVEIADYCFSGKSMPQDIVIGKDMTQLADRYIEKVILPDSVKRIGRLAFYNCRNLKTIEFPADIAEVDGDAFMNCTHLSLLVMRGTPDTRSCLKQILAQISWLVRVRWIEKSKPEEDKIIAQACFFEYDQSYDEIGPAHIFKLNMNGEGFRARQSFNDQIFVWKQYDDVFDEALAQESERDLLDMAFNRLIYPCGLEEAARDRYTDYVREHHKSLGQMLILRRDTKVLERYLELKSADGKSVADALNITDMITGAAENDWGEGSVILYRYKKKNIGTSRKDRFAF